MEYNKFSKSLLLRIGLLILPIFGIAYALHINDTFLITIFSILALILSVHLFRFVIRRYKEISYFLESVKYRDFSRKFSENQEPDDIIDLHKGFNTTINTIKDINTEKETQYLYLQKILEIVGTGIISYDLNSFEILWLNSSFQKILDIPSIKNINFIQKRFPESYSKIFETDHLKGNTVSIVSKNEEIKYWVSSTIFKIEDKQFKLITMQNIDFSLSQSESNAWKKLLSVMTHEIMNSVAPIASLAETLQNNIGSSLASKDSSTLDMNDIKMGIESIKNRSEGLMKFAQTYRSLNKITHLNKKEHNIKDLFENIVNLLSPSLINKGIDLKIDLDNSSMIVDIDTYLIEQVLINLILNAVESFDGNNNPTIFLTATRSLDGEITLSVSDNGEGIPEDIRDKIFIPFFTTKKNGNGIGLSLCSQIMMLHKGKIQINSVIGKGTKVSLLFLN